MSARGTGDRSAPATPRPPVGYNLVAADLSFNQPRLKIAVTYWWQRFSGLFKTSHKIPGQASGYKLVAAGARLLMFPRGPGDLTGGQDARPSNSVLSAPSSTAGRSRSRPAEASPMPPFLSCGIAAVYAQAKAAIVLPGPWLVVAASRSATAICKSQMLHQSEDHQELNIVQP